MWCFIVIPAIVNIRINFELVSVQYIIITVMLHNSI